MAILTNTVVFPTFIYYRVSPLLGQAAAVHLVWNLCVLALALHFFGIKVPLRRAGRMLIGLWAVGMATDIFGAALLAGAGSINRGLHVALMNGANIHASWTGSLILAATVLLCGLLLFVLDYIYLRTWLTKKQAARVALTFALLTAPYSFLIPA